MDFKKLASEVIREIRANHSQEQVNRKLGHTSNQLHRWEKGHAKIDWQDFCALTVVQKIDLMLLLNSYFRFKGNIESASDFLTHLFAGQAVSKVSRKVGISAPRLRRFLKGQSSLFLDDFLQIIFRLDRMESFSFVHDLVGSSTLPSLKAEKKAQEKIVKSYYKNPDLGLILICLNLPGYKKLSFHRDSFLADLCGLSIKEVHQLLQTSLELGLTEKMKGKYELTPFELSDRGARKEMLKVRAHWSKRGLAKLHNASTKNGGDDAFGSIVFTTSKESQKKIIASYLRFFEEFKTIVEEDQSPHDLALVMNFHLFCPGQDKT